MARQLSIDLRMLVLLVFAGLGIFSPARAHADRIPQTIDNTNIWRLRGSVTPLARPEFDRGKVDAALPMPGMRLVFSLAPAQQSSLDMLLAQQQDRASANYHKWLTPEQYAERFGLSAIDIERAATWLRQQGFSHVTVARSRTWIGFSGSAARVESAFRTAIHQYVVNGNTHYANTSEPSLPGAFRGVVQGITGLNDFRPRPRSIVVHPDFTSQVSGKHFLAPDDFATIYDIQGLYSSGTTGAGQSIAIVGQSDLSTDTNHGNQYDVVTFRNVSNLPPVNLQVVLVPGDRDPGIVSNDVDEANLDVEWSGAVAKDANLIYVNSQNALFSAIPYAIDQDLAPVISVSYGLCEAQLSSSEINTLTTVTQQANAQGQTIVASSGDSGPADCDYTTDPNNPVKIATHGYAVDVPASLPSVTGMGGTEFSEGDATGGTQYWSATNNGNSGSALSYIPEMAWNDTVINNFLAASGGGGSTLFSKPSWQTGAGGSPQHTFQQAFVADRRRRSPRWPARRSGPGVEFVGRSRWVSDLLAKQLRERVPEIRSDLDRDRRDVGGSADLCRHRGADRAEHQRSPGQRQPIHLLAGGQFPQRLPRHHSRRQHGALRTGFKGLSRQWHDWL